MQDAHLHLQDPRLKENQDLDSIICQMRATGITRCVVNGTSPDDWSQVSKLAQQHPELIIPSYGLHPWKTPCRSDWKPLLRQYLEKTETPCIGECGLDRWMPEYDTSAQEDAFNFQLDLACELNAPITIHILKAWGWFIDILRHRKAKPQPTHPPFPHRGFLLHSYNGSADLISELVDAGAYFSFSGYYLTDLKYKQLQIFTRIPIKRLLIETDAPDMLPPQHLITHPLPYSTASELNNQPINHPANLASIQQHLAQKLNLAPEKLQSQLSENFSRFFLSKSTTPR